MTDRRVRVRFAPSPTGALHIGGVRTALFNYLFARKHNGDFLLRIEDTDQTRFVPGAEDYIIESLKWSGLHYDEGVDIGGAYGPYRQSDRKAIYKQYADQLISSGNAYYAFDTPDELEAMRERLKNEKSSVQQYNASTRGQMKNSLTLSNDEIQTRLNSGESYVVRFKMPDNEDLVVNDIIRGEVTFNTSLLDDKVLFKSDGMPTYHLANVTDDYLMEISHVIRGEEWLPSLPLHVLLYRSFGWLDKMPQFAHLSLILKPEGGGKLSKRDGDRLGFPVFPLTWTDPISGEASSGYREAGYFPEAFVNLLALLGWNPGTEQELFTMDELIEAFSLEKVSKSGARFDPAKTRWFNHQYMQQKSDIELATLFQPELQKQGITADLDFVTEVCRLTKERVTFVNELWAQTSFFFVAPTSYDPQVVKKNWKDDSAPLLSELSEILKSVEPFDSHTMETEVKQWITNKGIGFGKVMNPWRLALVGTSAGPHLFDIAALIGKDETISRIERVIKELA